MELKSVGFLTEDLSSSQTAFTMIKSINSYVENNVDIDFSLFVENQFMPCIYPKCSKFSIRDAFIMYGSLIATSIYTAKQLGNFPRSKHYFYIQDLEYLRLKTPLEWHDIMFDREIIKFCRSKDHLNEIKSQQHYNSISDLIVEDFNIEQILEIVNVHT